MDFTIQADALRDRFLEQGYSHKALKRAYKKALESPTRTLTISGRTVILKKVKIRPINKESNDIFAVLCEHWHLLTQDTTIRHFVDPNPTSRLKEIAHLKMPLQQAILIGIVVIINV